MCVFTNTHVQFVWMYLWPVSAHWPRLCSHAGGLEWPLPISGGSKRPWPNVLGCCHVFPKLLQISRQFSVLCTSTYDLCERVVEPVLPLVSFILQWELLKWRNDRGHRPEFPTCSSACPPPLAPQHQALGTGCFMSLRIHSKATSSSETCY